MAKLEMGNDFGKSPSFGFILLDAHHSVGRVDFSQNESYDSQWKALIHRLRRTLSVRVGLKKER